MAKRLTSDDVERLAEIEDEIKTLVEEGLRIVSGTDEEDRGRRVFIAGLVRAALDETRAI